MEDQIKATIASANQHVLNAYDKLEEMGATMPDHKNIENLKDTIYTLPLDVDKVTVTFDAGEGTPSPATQELYPGQTAAEPVHPTKESCIFLGWYKTDRLPMPDLSQPLDATGLKQLQKIVASGQASEYLNLGDELKAVYMGGDVMPFEVVGFEDVELQDGTKQPAINLLAKYTTSTTTVWGNSGSVKYSASTLRNFIADFVQANLDADFVDCLANGKTQTYSRDGSTDVVYDKLFAPSMAQLGVDNGDLNHAVEGPTFTWYIDSGNAKRIKQASNATDTAQLYWTRSLNSTNSNNFGLINASGSPAANPYSYPYRVVAACNFVGTSTPVPASYTVTFQADGATNVPAPQTVAGGGSLASQNLQ